ncbi:MAG: DUF1573 domain-containing protein [Chitinophagales bacterium]|nr:DUF1573 domain-containing protein [Chitinophagales bacterium]MCZ2393760.1 DUF1573 domain-containing protein [Chitinophagales bacterium]
MKYLFTLLSILFLSAGISNAQTELNLNSKISFSKQEHNFGILPIGKPVTYEFEFTNIGNKPLILSEVKASCGCTTPSWSKQPVLPGQKGFVKAQYNMAREGKYRKSVTVKTADGETITLYITGEAVQANSVENAKPSIFGN